MKSAEISGIGNRAANQTIESKNIKINFFNPLLTRKNVPNYNLTLPRDVCTWTHRLRYHVSPYGDSVKNPICFPGARSCGYILHGAGATKIEWFDGKRSRAKRSFIRAVRKSSLLCYHRILRMQCIL